MSRRSTLVVLGATVIAFAGLAMVAGLAIALVFGSGNALASGSQPLTTPGRALVSPMAEFDGVGKAPSVLGQPSIDVEVDVHDRGVFVGVAAATEVERYLAGADVDDVTDVQFRPFRVTTRHQAGSAVVRPPGTEHFWVARAEADSGTARLSWPLRDGDYRLVFMNADGSADVHADVRVALVLPSATKISGILLAGGFGVALLGGLLLTLGLRAGPSTGSMPPPTGPRPSAGAPPFLPVPTQDASGRATTASGDVAAGSRAAERT